MNFIIADLLVIKAKINGKYGTIVNRILRVPYSSSLELHCVGPNILTWVYKKSALPFIYQVAKHLKSVINNNKHTIISFDNFNKNLAGFYTCSSNSPRHGKKTVLVVGGKKMYFLDLRI